MTIYDLNWHPSILGIGFVACTRFDDGITAHVSCADGATYNLVIDGRGRGHLHHYGLTASKTSELLDFYAKSHAL